MVWKYTLVRVTQNISSMSVKSTVKSIASPPYTLNFFACRSIYYTSISWRTSLNFCWSFGQSVIDGFWFNKTITEDSFSFFFGYIFWCNLIGISTVGQLQQILCFFICSYWRLFKGFLKTWLAAFLLHLYKLIVLLWWYLVTVDILLNWKLLQERKAIYFKSDKY